MLTNKYYIHEKGYNIRISRHILLQMRRMGILDTLQTSKFLQLMTHIMAKLPVTSMQHTDRK